MDLDRRVLLTAPWCWPPPQSRARDLLVETLGAVPSLPVGRAPAVTIRGEAVTLWCLDPDTRADGVPYRDAPGFSRLPLGPEALASWQAAALALPRSLPLLWRSVHDAARDLPVATFLRSHLDVPGFEERQRVLDGAAFGLTFFLILASRVLGAPLPDDVIAVAGIDDGGGLSAVDGIEARVTGVVAVAPSIRRVLVCADQVNAARAAADGRLEIVGARAGADAVVQLYGPDLADHLVAAGTDAERRAELVEAFFRLALTGRGPASLWSPIERGAATALREWPLVDEQEYRLQFASAVAARHDRNAGELPLPDEMHSPDAWLEQQPAPIRLALLTHLVRQSAAAGTPPWPKTEALALRALPARFEDALLPHLTLMGALARLWSITGREMTALVVDRRLARAFAQAFAEQEVSWPLAEVFRLAGLLRDRAAYEDADDLREQVLTAGGFGPRGAPHVELMRARAQILLGRADEPALDQLHALAQDRTVPAHVRGSASRWFVRGLRERRHDDSASEHLARFEQVIRAEAIEDQQSERFLVLAHLDAAIATGDATRAANLVAHLERLDPGPVGHLLGVSQDALFVASRYPY